MREGLIFLTIGPSGTGKSSIIEGVVSRLSNIERIVTYTTRERRPGEVEGFEYHFVSTDEFERLKAAGELAEWQAFYGHQYGSSRDRLESAMAKGLDLIGAYDVLGSVELTSRYPRHVVTVFILPPSVEELRRRLIDRYGEETEEGRVRLNRLEMEMSHADSFKYHVCNEDLEEAIEDMIGIVRAERSLVERPDAST
ncbi:MAG: guanylate kinase [Anaerolineae bacterium]|nr:guanylate kinase [Anaerolineae bacterium]NIN93567.1 guanylate kinase [Anaerolineae bacterium]NIQ76650.1 guanylate kinase [Anaerolineae bacterium]